VYAGTNRQMALGICLNEQCADSRDGKATHILQLTCQIARFGLICHGNKKRNDLHYPTEGCMF